MKPLLVTGSDSKYFPYVQGTIASIRKQQTKVAIGFLDLGCTSNELTWLRWAGVDLVQQPRDHFSYPSQSSVPTHYKGNLARAFLPEYFPGFDIYLWIDADAWVCDQSAVDLLLAGAQQRGCAIVQEISHSSPLLYGHLPSVHQWSRNYYEQVYGSTVAERFYSFPVLNNGVMAIAHDAPHWSSWQQHLAAGLNASPIQMTDQMSLNLAIWDGLQAQTEFLPPWCNWTVHAFGFPCWQLLNNTEGRWVEPTLPFQPIGILHLTGEKVERAVVTTTTRTVIERSLLYPSHFHPRYLDLLALNVSV